MLTTEDIIVKFEELKAATVAEREQVSAAIADVRIKLANIEAELAQGVAVGDDQCPGRACPWSELLPVGAQDHADGRGAAHCGHHPAGDHPVLILPGGRTAHPPVIARRCGGGNGGSRPGVDDESSEVICDPPDYANSKRPSEYLP